MVILPLMKVGEVGSRSLVEQLLHESESFPRLLWIDPLDCCARVHHQVVPDGNSRDQGKGNSLLQSAVIHHGVFPVDFQDLYWDGNAHCCSMFTRERGVKNVRQATVNGPRG